MTVVDSDSHTLRTREHRAILALLIACAMWGMSFNWNKEAQAIVGDRLVEAGGDPELRALGPCLFLAARFSLAVVLWAAVFPRSLRGWTGRTVAAGVGGGLFLSSGMLLQHYGLSLTTESLSAFLTSLTVLFTPLLATLVLRRRIGGALWASVACATAGVAVMTLYREEGRFEKGALLGVLCAVVFSAHILWVDYFGRRESAWRFTLAQFAAAAVVFTAFTAASPGGRRLVEFDLVMDSFASARFAVLASLSLVFSTLVTFGLMFRFQPDTSPTRAALVYLTEPLFATVYAWFASGRSIGGAAMFGAVLIILGNLVAERFARRGGSASDEIVAPAYTSSDG
ncbi:MAG: DMT family transporter [Phycisphaerales bacterium]|nr:DMT family transporter [Phycisphaerales bacterium]